MELWVVVNCSTTSNFIPLTIGTIVIYESISEMHVSGHASQEELKLSLFMMGRLIDGYGQRRMSAVIAQATSVLSSSACLKPLPAATFHNFIPRPPSPGLV